jgi:hypothetical protein
VKQQAQIGLSRGLVPQVLKIRREIHA